jgi:hypothetical protein
MRRSTWRMYCIPLVLLATATAAAKVAAAEPTAAEVALRLKRAFPGMPAQATVEATVVPGIYAMRVPGFAGCTPYVDGDVSMIANNGTRGWTEVGSGRPIDDERLRDLVKRAYAHLPRELIPMGAGQDRGMVLISGVDCQPSAETEALLAREKIAYRVLPGALQPANLGETRKAACATDPAAAWQSSRRQGGRVSGAQKASCGFDPQAARDISCMFQGGRLPTALFADGRVSLSSDQIPVLAGKAR